ncbi:hypothetical protein [Halocatena halophila]|uniref:hypothetical protein n=1 Tax=Halocatena halophila TaxID=2814576 RepID=UPI002ED15AF6
MVDIDSLDPEVRMLAFWLQTHLYEQGVDGIHFMEAGEKWAEENAADTTADAIGNELRKL